MCESIGHRPLWGRYLKGHIYSHLARLSNPMRYKSFFRPDVMMIKDDNIEKKKKHQPNNDDDDDDDDDDDANQ